MLPVCYLVNNNAILQVHGIASMLQEQAVTELAGLTALEHDLKQIAKVQY